ncbi:MAG: cupin domain-containing protein [Lewinellaceae bacterium]|nr:cupin domain-containing protein [Lewinellaceae bacterium]
MKDSRRQFIRNSGITSILGIFPGLYILNSAEIGNLSLKEGFVCQPENQETYLIAGRQAPVTLMINKIKHGINSVSFCKEEIVENDFIPIHKHGREEEIIYIQNGRGLFILGEKEFKVSAGSIAFVPKNIWHGLKNIGSDVLTMIFSYSPSGFENYFREIGVAKGEEWIEKTPEEYNAIDKKYSIVYKYTPPRWE